MAGNSKFWPNLMRPLVLVEPLQNFVLTKKCSPNFLFVEKGNLECSQYSKLILNDQGCPSYPIRINLVILAFLDLHSFCFLHFFMSPLIKSVNRGMLVFITFRSEYVVHSTNEKLVYFFWWYSILKHLNETDI